MEALKVVPQIFFDIIARLIPGSVTVVALDYAVQRNVVKIVIEAAVPNPDLTKSTLVWLMIFLGCSYVIGHMLAPLTRLFGERIIGKLFTPAGEQELKRIADEKDNCKYPPNVCDFLRREISDATTAQYKSTIFVWYDWLRVNHPEAGSFVAKMRAEYTMYAAIAAAGVVTFLLHLTISAYRWWSAQAVDLRKPFILTAILSTFLMLWRYRDTYDQFQRSVINLYYVGKSSTPVSASA